MIKHIVIWKLKDHAHGLSKEELALSIKSKLEELDGKIPGMHLLEVGMDFNKSASAFDLVLYSEFESKAALDGYQGNPLHKAILPYIAESTLDRKVVDYVN